MPATQTSPASSRHRCTETIAVLQCTGLDVAISGDRCALHLYSTDGKTTVLLPTERFLKGARGLHDCNGHLFPARRKERHEMLREQLEHDAEVSRALRAPAMPAVDPQPIAPPPAPVEPKLDDGVKAPQPPPAAVEDRPARGRPNIGGLTKLPPRAAYFAREKALREAWDVYISTPDMNLWQLSQVLDCRASYLNLKFQEFAEEPGAPVLKPNGKF